MSNAFWIRLLYAKVLKECAATRVCNFLFLLAHRPLLLSPGHLSFASRMCLFGIQIIRVNKVILTGKKVLKKPKSPSMNERKLGRRGKRNKEEKNKKLFVFSTSETYYLRSIYWLFYIYVCLISTSIKISNRS